MVLGDYSLVVVHGLLNAVASLVSTGSRVHKLLQLPCMGSVVAALRLKRTGSVVVAHRLRCSTACRITLEKNSEISSGNVERSCSSDVAAK